MVCLKALNTFTVNSKQLKKTVLYAHEKSIISIQLLSKSIKIWNELYKKSKRNWKGRDLEHFANVKIYLRKWVSEAFAGVLGGDVLLYVWDLVRCKCNPIGSSISVTSTD